MNIDTEDIRDIIFDELSKQYSFFDELFYVTIEIRQVTKNEYNIGKKSYLIIDFFGYYYNLLKSKLFKKEFRIPYNIYFYDLDVLNMILQNFGIIFFDNDTVRINFGNDSVIGKISSIKFLKTENMIDIRLNDGLSYRKTISKNVSLDKIRAIYEKLL